MSQPINDGGPAFPHTTQWDGITPAINHHGISMRDYFAGQAMAAIIASVYCTPETIYTEVSSRAYAQADAMRADLLLWREQEVKP